jgi:Mlc titration factor MtfA (ptsG expression regulator)
MGGVYALLVVSRRLMRFLPAGKPLRLPTDPAPETWPGIIERLVPLSRRLNDAERLRLLQLTQLFVGEAPMEGCGGLELTEEIRVTIAATACLLLLNLAYPRFAALRRVLVYPDAFVPVRLESRHSLGIADNPSPELGEAWRDGIVVLSWKSVRSLDANGGDGHNVVLHEFAHVLDGEDGAFDGTPILESEQAVRNWTRIFVAEFEREQDAVNRSSDPALDPYAATNRAEFFAVATEAFYESAVKLRDRLPELYEQLRQFYRQDPAARTGGRSDAS